MSNNNKQINSLSKLQKEIELLKLKINSQEADLLKRAKIMPRKIVAASLGSGLAFLLDKKLVSVLWDVAKIATGVAFKKQNPFPAIKTLAFKKIKAIGLVSLVKSLFSTFKNFTRKSHKNSS